MCEDRKLYLKLFHGMNDLAQDMDDWGFDGPCIGPLQWVHTTYESHIKLRFVDRRTLHRFFNPLDDTVMDEGTAWVECREGCLPFNGHWFGDWSACLLTEEEARMPFEIWEDIHGDEARIAFAESGADREADFDLEEALEAAYEAFVGEKA